MKTMDLERLVCDFLSFVPDEETKRKYMELGRYNQKQNVAINYIRDALKHAIRQQGREYKDGRLVPIGHERFDMKAGAWYVCVRDGVFGGYPDGDTHFHKGEVYFCDESGIIDHNSNNFHEDFKTGEEKVWDYFRPWDIYDARPGDVLCDAGGNVGIFEKVFGLDWHSAAYLGCTGTLMTGLGGSHCIEGSMPATREQRDSLFRKLRETGYRWNEETLKLEKVKEERFKAGEWIVYTGRLLRGSGTDGYVMQIESVEDGRYSFTDGSTLCFDSEKDMRLWTIQDAKPGDVLCYTNGEWVFIYKSKDDTVIKYYALLSERGLSVNDAACIVLECCVTPATKAQRDLLFKRMQESGYRWNEETLKLEKTEEEKPTATEKEPSVQQTAMIKASELMLGDWMRYAGTGELMQVTRIDAIMDGSGHFACGLPHRYEYNNKFEPVLLTAEMLERNGFEYHSGERGMYGVTTANYYAMEGSPHFFCDGDPFAVWFEDEVPIRYVHELQHVLKLCGIEKEFVI